MAKLTDDMNELKPTMMVSVPRLLNRFNDLIQKRLEQLEGMSKSMAEQGLKTKLAAVESSGACTNYMYDSAIFNRF